VNSKQTTLIRNEVKKGSANAGQRSGNSEPGTLNCICIGGWGHWPEVLDALQARGDVIIAGIAPAYAGEELTAICAHSLAAGAPVFDSADELLKIPAEFCVISTRPDHIAGAIIAAANAGKHIITEKPTGITFGQLDAAERAVKENGVRIAGMFTMRTFQVFQAARNLCRAGKIGMPVLVNARKSYKYGLRFEWFGDRNRYGGTFPWIGIHAFDMIRFITGLLPERVAALHKNQAHPERRDCEDSCVAVCELTGGALATISLDLCRPAGAAEYGDDWIRIVGTAGVIEARYNEKTCTLLIDGIPAPVKLAPAESIYSKFIDGGADLPVCSSPEERADRNVCPSSERADCGADFLVCSLMKERAGGDACPVPDIFALTRACLFARQAADEKQWKEIQ